MGFYKPTCKQLLSPMSLQVGSSAQTLFIHSGAAKRSSHCEVVGRTGAWLDTLTLASEASRWLSPARRPSTTQGKTNREQEERKRTAGKQIRGEEEKKKKREREGGEKEGRRRSRKAPRPEFCTRWGVGVVCSSSRPWLDTAVRRA